MPTNEPETPGKPEAQDNPEVQEKKSEAQDVSDARDRHEMHGEPETHAITDPPRTTAEDDAGIFDDNAAFASRRTDDKIITAFFKLLRSHGYSAATMPRIASEAGIPLSTLRNRFSSRPSVIFAALARVDECVAERLDPDLADAPAHDRLFDAIMVRLEILSNQKESVSALAHAVRRHPWLALCARHDVAESSRRLLRMISLETTGSLGTMRTQGATLGFALAIQRWLRDDDPEMNPTMEVLDRTLRRGGHALAFASRFCRRSGLRPV